MLAGSEVGAYGDCKFKVRGPALGSFHGCLYQVMTSERGMKRRGYTYFIKRFMCSGVNEKGKSARNQEMCSLDFQNFF